MAQRSYVQRCKSAEDEVRQIAADARGAVAKLSAMPLLLDAAMAVILKHDLLTELAEEHTKREAPAGRAALQAKEEGKED